MRILIYNPASELFNFFEDALFYELQLKNIELIKYIYESSSSTISSENIKLCNKSNKYNPFKDIILIIVNPHYIYDYPEIKYTILQITKTFKYKIFYLTEPINFIIEKRVFTDLIKMIKPYALWTYTMDNFKKLNIYQPVFKVFPHYNETFNMTSINIESLKVRNKECIIFFGNINNVREPICTEFAKYIINETSIWSKIGWSNILNKNLFYLNIHRRDKCKSFETFRIIPILANGGVVFSEEVNEDEYNQYNIYNIIFCKKDKLFNTFLEYMKNINYDDIFNKAELFRIDYLNNNCDLDNFIEYHNSLI